jgi:hypothetical protein
LGVSWAGLVGREAEFALAAAAVCQLSVGRASALVIEGKPVAEGLTNGAVARRLDISRHAASTRLRHLFATLGAPDWVALAAGAHHSIK